MYPLDLLVNKKLSYCGGFSLSGNAGGFDFGFVANRIDTSRNVAGVYFKGDAEIGIQAAYAFHFNNEFDSYFSEANLGIDYSFLEGHLIVNLMFYYNERGATSPGNFKMSPDYFFTARYYINVSLMGVIDEFLSTQLNCFVNLVDGSLLIMPSLKWTIVNGLNMTIMFPVPTGRKAHEFSYATMGHFSAIMRIEWKF